VLDGGMSLGHYFTADIWSARDYYPFGSQLMGRSWQAGEYRFGFNGMEGDDEITTEGGSLNFGARIYDSKIGRWLSKDPMEAKYPAHSPYNFVANSPLMYVDKDGRDIYIVYKGREYHMTWPKLRKMREEMIENPKKYPTVFQALVMSLRLPGKIVKNPVTQNVVDPNHDVFIVVAETNNDHHAALPNAFKFNKGENGTFEFDKKAFLEFYKKVLPEHSFTEEELETFESLNGTDISSSKHGTFSMIILSDEEFGDPPSGQTVFLSSETEVNEENAAHEGAATILHEFGNHINERNNRINPGGVHVAGKEAEWNETRNDQFFGQKLMNNLRRERAKQQTDGDTENGSN
jgi:RHS repeat-associated protein